MGRERALRIVAIGLARDLERGKELLQLGKRYRAVYPAALSEEGVDHAEKLMAELHEFVRRVGHDEKLSQMIDICDDRAFEHTVYLRL